jgi:hypothetical protein
VLTKRNGPLSRLQRFAVTETFLRRINFLRRSRDPFLDRLNAFGKMNVKNQPVLYKRIFSLNCSGLFRCSKSIVKVVNLLDRKWSGVPALVLIIGSAADWVSLARDDPQSHMPVDENRIRQGFYC